MSHLDYANFRLYSLSSNMKYQGIQNMEAKFIFKEYNASVTKAQKSIGSPIAERILNSN